MNDLEFPKGFLWGAATSSHQVEGDQHNDWTAWEDAGHTLDGSHSGAAADHWNLYKKDFQILSKLHLNAYRFSIEWSRVEPQRGKFDEAALTHYAEMVNELKKQGIKPVVTLHHFTNPIWINTRGGWADAQTVDDFVRFASLVVERLGEDVQLWCTINEPTIFAGLGYLIGIFPPGKRNILAYWRTQRNLLAAHQQVYQQIHAIHKRRKWQPPVVMLANNTVDAQTKSGRLGDRLFTGVYSYFADRQILRKTMDYIDAIGVNYYFYRRISFRIGGSGLLFQEDQFKEEQPASDLGWHIHPEGLYHVLRSLKKYDKPIYILENGLADATDEIRPWSIVRHLQAIHKALDEGVDVRGYFHWSFLDTFEWENGYLTRYGLVAVDFSTQGRTVRRSGEMYGEIARANAIPPGILERYQ